VPLKIEVLLLFSKKVNVEAESPVFDNGYAKLQGMINRVVEQRSKGFTIVELLIVVVVIAILAAITIVSYNGVQNRASDAAVKSELAQNVKLVMNAANTAGVSYTTAAVMSGTSTNLKFDTSRYRVVTYCTNGSEFALAVETTTAKKYYIKSGGVAVNDDTIDSFLPCGSLSIAGAQTTYLNLPTVCTGENTTCNFTGTATVVYGSASVGRFARTANLTGSAVCSNAAFIDPAPGFTKACYVYPN